MYDMICIYIIRYVLYDMYMAHNMVISLGIQWGICTCISACICVRIFVCIGMWLYIYTHVYGICKCKCK